jgi:NAD(P)-dependent dehydrogenase (short-subunit alcohol dehydrogenase family)
MEKKTVLVTGASSGIGAAAARAFASAGFCVFGTSRRPRAGEGGVEMLELDVRSDASVERCVAEVLRRSGRIDALVNNAGVMHMGVAEETSSSDARAVFETNFFGASRMINAVLPHMRARQGGHIINVGSLAAWVGEPGEAFYSASKHALAGYTEALRHEVWPLGVHVSLVEPGAFRTDVVRAASTSDGGIPDYDAVRRATRRTLEASLGRGEDPARVADVIVKIAQTASPRFRYGVGAEARWLPYRRVLLPQRLFDFLVRRGFGITGPSGSSRPELRR